MRYWDAELRERPSGTAYSAAMRRCKSGFPSSVISGTNPVTGSCQERSRAVRASAGVCGGGPAAAQVLFSFFRSGAALLAAGHAQRIQPNTDRAGFSCPAESHHGFSDVELFDDAGELHGARSVGFAGERS